MKKKISQGIIYMNENSEDISVSTDTAGNVITPTLRRTLEEVFAEQVRILQELGVPETRYPIGYNYTLPCRYHGSELQTVLLEFMPFVTTQLSLHRSPTENKGYPPGMWYMVTVTTPSGSTEERAMDVHERAMKYFGLQKAKVAIAALEKSSIYHIHYAVSFVSYPKNMKRDLSKECFSYIVDVSKKVRNLKDFNGLCKYCLKRDYEEKSKTSIQLLVNHVEYIEGSGYHVSDDF